MSGPTPAGCSSQTWELFMNRIAADMHGIYTDATERICEWQQGALREASSALLRTGDDAEPILKAEALLFLNMLETSLILFKLHIDDKLPLEHQLCSITREVERDHFLFERTSALQSKMQEVWDGLVLEKELVAPPSNSSTVLKPRLDMLEIAADNDRGGSRNKHGGDSLIYKAPKTFAMPFRPEGEEVSAGDERAERLRRSEFVRAVTEKYSEAPLIIGDEDDAIAEVKGITRGDVSKFKAIQRGSAKTTAFSASTLKNLKKIPKLAGLATVGSSLDSISKFVDSIGASSNKANGAKSSDRKRHHVNVKRTGPKRK